LPQNIRELWGRIAGIFDPGGSLSQSLPSFEARPGQKDMAEMVFKAMMQECVAMVEAGTGTGKTLAYLIPSVFVSLALSEPVVVSTQTINLQEQIIHSDIPLLQMATGEQFRTVLVKGWSNYLCLRRFHRIEESSELFDLDELESFRMLKEWAAITATGSRSDMEFAMDERVWERVRAEASACTFNRCPWYGQCYFFAHRKKIKSADIIVTNHAFLFSQVAARKNSPSEAWTVMPDFKRLIIDEAHHAEEVASEFLGDEASSTEFTRILSTLLKPGRGAENAGLLPRIRSARFSPSTEARIRTILDSYCIPMFRSLRETFDGLTHRMVSSPSLRDETDKILLTPAFRDEAREGAGEEIRLFTARLNEYRQQLERLVAEGVRESEDLAVETGSVIQRMEAFRDSLVRIWNGGDGSMVYSLEYSRRPRAAFMRLKSYPLGVSDILFDELFKPLKTVVLTSATLAINRNFKFLARQLGIDRLDKDVVLTGIIESPFQFDQQAILAVPTDLPMADQENFLPMAAPHLARLIEVMEGRTFILFTSYRMLKECAAILRQKLDGGRFNLLVQGEMPRHLLLERFKEKDFSVLLGTDSFWEGVDVPGRDLECVVLMKLPFRVPTDPIIKARTDHIKKEGKNPFLTYHVPKAVIRFKQGFGRLIRNRKDRGAIVVLDRRILEKQYGAIFLNSLPSCPLVKGSFAGIINHISRTFPRTQQI
jgi:ATP-dependent DNA helicase DinG